MRKELLDAMTAYALMLRWTAPEVEERLGMVGGSLDPNLALELARRRQYFETYEARSKEIAKAYAAVADDTDPETLPIAVRVLHEALGKGGDDGEAYRLLPQLSEVDADAVIYAIGEAVNWETERVTNFLFDLAGEGASAFVRSYIVRAILMRGMVDETGESLEKITGFLGRPLTDEELEDFDSQECAAFYFAGRISFETGDEDEDGTSLLGEPVTDAGPFIALVLGRKRANPMLLRLIARSLIDWNDAESNYSFATLVANIPD